MSAPKHYQVRVQKHSVRDRLIAPFQRFAQGEANSGILLLVCALAAMAWANLAASGAYDAFWHQPLAVQVGAFQKSLSYQEWINDGLMTLFFLHVGLEIKREFLIGELSNRSAALFPIVAAIGGMVVPAAIFAILNRHDVRGAGVPMATDIAFSLGILALLGSRIPTALKVFLTAVAIVDDLGGVAVIAIFYNHGFLLGALVGVLLCAVALAAMNYAGVRSLLAFGLVGFILWVFMAQSGIHATVAGVLLAMTIPTGTRVNLGEFADELRESLGAFQPTKASARTTMNEDRKAAIRRVHHAVGQVTMPLESLEHLLAPWVTFGIVPLFAMANAGVDLRGVDLSAPSTVAVGIVSGLVFGKPIGIFGGALFAQRVMGLQLPADISWRTLGGVGLLGGIGFTMSLFIAQLAFGQSSTQNEAKTAILLASVLSGVMGFAWLARVARPSATEGA